jgi:hypothetical protein
MMLSQKPKPYETWASSYRASDAEDKAQKGSEPNINATYRYDTSLLTASKVFRHLIATEDERLQISRSNHSFFRIQLFGTI